jgi:hypothetical protein
MADAKKRAKRPKAPRDAAFEDRAVLLAKRLGIPVPENRTPRSMIRMWAMIGDTLAENEPEFRWGAGRPKGSKSKQLAPVGPDGARKRRWREKRERDKN